MDSEKTKLIRIKKTLEKKLKNLENIYGIHKCYCRMDQLNNPRLQDLEYSTQNVVEIILKYDVIKFGERIQFKPYIFIGVNPQKNMFYLEMNPLSDRFSSCNPFSSCTSYMRLIEKEIFKKVIQNKIPEYKRVYKFQLGDKEILPKVKRNQLYFCADRARNRISKISIFNNFNNTKSLINSIQIIDESLKNYLKIVNEPKPEIAGLKREETIIEEQCKIGINNAEKKFYDTRECELKELQSKINAIVPAIINKYK